MLNIMNSRTLKSILKKEFYLLCVLRRGNIVNSNAINIKVAYLKNEVEVLKKKKKNNNEIDNKDFSTHYTIIAF